MNTRYFLFQKNKVVFRKCDPRPAPVLLKEFEELTGELSHEIILPEAEIENGAFAAELPENMVLPGDYSETSLRSLVGKVDDPLFACWGKASQILHWFRSNRFCGSCGSRTKDHSRDTARQCPSCNDLYYPTISPCIIVLVYRESEILLARSPRFPQEMYSTLAGFVEIGESAEQTVHREIFEEVGLRVKNLRYFKSQPWPFPGQLMLGYFAEFESGNIQVDGNEICDAAWYGFDELPQIPSPATISGQLIRYHIADMRK